MYVRTACKKNFDDVIQKQIKRKKAQSEFWNIRIVEKVYTFVMKVHEKLRYAKYIALLKESKPKNVIIWNGKKLPNITVVMAAEHLKINVFYFENGLMPGTTTLDPKGVNASASLTRDPSFYLKFDPENKLSFSPPQLSQRGNHKKRQVFLDKDLPENYIFVAFQVPHDTQIASHSPWISSMEMLYDEVIKAVKSINDPSLKVVFKEHPTWHKHYESLYYKNDIGIFANGNTTSELIQQSKAVITINSTVGLEALLLNKKVITLGEACYNIEDLVLHANNSHDLIYCVKKINQGWTLNQILRDKFFTYLEHVYCIPGSRKEAEKKHLDAIRNRLNGSDSFSLSLNKKTPTRN
jgi:capsular polysaccharide export protein